jgi:glutamine amidotransferase
MIGILNYGLGNIKAFENIYRKNHVPVKIVSQEADLSGVERLILPGVGAFDHAMLRFNESGLRSAVEEMVLIQKVPVIGICVGMQMLANGSEEGQLPGLGWVPGFVKRFDESEIPYDTHLPHMGWNDVVSVNEEGIFAEMQEPLKFYFLHSYYFESSYENHALATAEYGISFTCAVRNENIYGVQFHPEKSHHCGIQLLLNFSEL